MPLVVVHKLNLVVFAGTAGCTFILSIASFVADRVGMVPQPWAGLIGDHSRCISELSTCGPVPKSAFSLHWVALPKRNAARTNTMTDVKDHRQEHVMRSNQAQIKVRCGLRHCAFKALADNLYSAARQPRKQPVFLLQTNEVLG